MSFTLGLSYLKIADIAIDTLDNWYKNFEITELKLLLTSVMPYLDPYLRNKVYTGDPDLKSSYSKPKRFKKGQKQQQIPIETESELLILQKKIIIFVGQLDPEISLQMIVNDKITEKVPWYITPNLELPISYADITSTIYLDKIVPRIIELALHSGDRKTRTSACEVLHGVMTVLLGTIRGMSYDKSRTTFEKLFRYLITPLIQLGCDSDELIKQIFNEFIFQLIHWYTSREKLKSFESEILIETLMVSYRNIIQILQYHTAFRTYNVYYFNATLLLGLLFRYHIHINL